MTELTPNRNVVKLKPRRYQLELFKQTLDSNAIIFLGTGLGKTYIVVRYLEDASVVSRVQDGKRAVFLAPTQDLIKQQAEYISKQLNYRAKVYNGRSSHEGQHIDRWSADNWAQEIVQIELLFMTPQIFASAIQTNLLDWQQFCAVIFDEVHHACRNKKKKESGHPYGQILSSYNTYYQSRPDAARPRLIGLTASLLNNMPKDRSHIRSEVLYMERLMHARCITDLYVQDIRPLMVIHSYLSDNLTKINDILSGVFEAHAECWRAALKTKELDELLAYKPRGLTDEERKMLTFYNRLKLASTGFSIKPSSLPKVMDALSLVRKRCGLWALRAVCVKLIEPIRKHSNNPCATIDMRPLYEEFAHLLTKIRDALDEFIGPSDDVLQATRTKSLALLAILESEHKRAQSEERDVQFSCIVFVRSRLEVVALTQWIQRVSLIDRYSFIRCDYAVGLAATMASKYSCITKRNAAEQKRMLDKFRTGDLNVIVTTSVLEEGIDLPTCSTVIRYDKARNFREFVQSRGRARQRDSTFVALSELGDSADMQKCLNIFHDFEVTIKETLSDEHFKPNAQPTTVKEYCVENAEDSFITKDGRVRITPPVAKIILNMYCNRLSQHTPFADGIRYEREKKNDQYRTILYLPSGCPLPGGVTGGYKCDVDTADDSAAVATVKALCEANELDEHGVPARISEKNIDKLLVESGLNPSFEPLEKRLNGLRDPSGDETVAYFEPKVLRLEGNMSKDCSSRLYKLFKLSYEPAPNQFRDDTKHLFQQSQFGLIVDNQTNVDMIPKQLYSHYGLMNVRLEQVHEKLLISKVTEHNELLNFTHKLLFRVLGIRDLYKEELKARCQLYLVLLNSDNQPDILRMRNTFTGHKPDIVEGDVVRIRDVYADFKEKSKLMVVLKVHREMNANSTVPGTKLTFREFAGRKYGTDIVTTIDQPVVELMTLSKEFASIRQGKKIKESYESRPIFMLHQFLEFFDSSAPAVIQSFMKPEIIYSIYSSLAISDLCSKFLSETSDRRREMFIINSQNAIETPLALPMELVDNNNEGDDQNGSKDAPARGDEPKDQVLEDENSEDEEGEESDELDESVESGDCDSDRDENARIGVDYNSMLGQRIFKTDSYDDSAKMEQWDLDQYQVNDLRTLNYSYTSTLEPDPHLERSARVADVFNRLSDAVLVHSASIVKSLKELELRLISDAWLVNENEEFKKRTAVVDHTLSPPLKLDRNAAKLYPDKSREHGFMEALTLRRAQQSYSLEGLEHIGDSYLKYVVSVVLFHQLDGNEGFLTFARSRLTSNMTFNYLAKKNQLGSYAIGRSFDRDILAYALGRPIKCDILTVCNKMRPKDLADLFESIVGSCLVYEGEFEAILAMDWLGLNIFKEGTFEELHENAVVFSRAPSALIKVDEGGDFGSLMDRQYRELRAKFTKFESILGYNFNDPSYLIQAFTHASSPTRVTRSYERLEFLGDAILDFLVTATLTKTSSYRFNPGQMTASRSALVNNYAFARVAMKYKFDLFIQHFNDSLYDELSKVRLALDEDPELISLDMSDFDSVVKLLGDVFESVAGAIYLDSGCSLDTVWSIYYPMLKEFIDQELQSPSRNLVSLLHETFPGKNRVFFEAFAVPSSTIDEPRVGVRCIINGLGSYEGIGLTKRQAKRRAVEETVRRLPSQNVITRLNDDYKSVMRPALPVRRGRGRGRGGRGQARSRYNQRRY